MKKKLLLIIMVLLSINLFAQNKQVKGKVTSVTDGYSLPGVTIIIKGTNNGTITDLDGLYILEAPKGSTLVFSFVGYQNQEVVVVDQTEINISLALETKGLEEIIVVGYGTQKKSLVTGSIAKVDAAEMVKGSALRVNQALQGKTAGVVITNNSGQPGEFVSVRVRGTGTNGDAEPLYIVDGMPTNGYGIDYLNATDIESIEVLKDAAAGIYGARGANGVILITTKTGKKNEKYTVSYDMYYGVQNPWKKQDVLNAQEYMDIMNESAVNAGKKELFPQAVRDTIKWDTDWQEEMFYRNAPKQSHVVSFTGGTDKSTFSSSLSYMKQDGIIAKGNSDWERYTFRVNHSREFGIFTLGTNLSLANIASKLVSANDTYDGSALIQALNAPPIVPVKYADGKWGTPQDYGLGMQEISNPIALLSYRNSKTITKKAVGSLYGEFDFGKLNKVLNGLRFRTSYNLEYSLVNKREYFPKYDLDATHKALVNGTTSTDDKYNTWNFENILTYTKSIGQSNFTGLLGHTAFRYTYESLSGSKNQLIFDDYDHAYLNNATDPTSANTSGTFEDHTLLSYFGRLEYDYANKYMLTATLRRDGSSRFGDKNKFGNFPSVSAGWVVSRESFFPQTNLMSLLKFRASWGQNGNENIGDFRYTSTMSSNNNYFFGINQTQYNGVQPSRIPNLILKWETSQQSNIALDMGFFANQLTLSIDLYDKKTKDWLVDAPAPLLLGNTPPTINGGEIQNKGVEIELGFKKQLGELNMDITLTGASNTNKVLDIQNSEKVLKGGTGGFGQADIERAEVGQPMGYFWGYKTNGIFQNQAQIDAYINDKGKKLQTGAKPGDVIFVDTNKDGLLDDKDRVKLGDPHPKFTGGININLNWKGLDFNMFWYAALGQQGWMAIRRYDQPTSNFTRDFVDGRWTGEGTSNKYPRVTLSDANFNGNWKTPSDLFVYESSYTRFRNLTVGYTLPKFITTKAGISKLRIYFTGENLLTLTKYPGYDPEIGGKVFEEGIERGIYPQPRTILAGLGITF